MPKQHTDEQFPLLLFIVGNDQELSKNNKGFKSRVNGITSGATAVITEWPNYISSCWTTSILIAVTLFFMTLALFTCVNIENNNNNRFPRCTTDFPNQTIHLVLENSTRWTWHQLDLLKSIKTNFPTYQINIIMVDKWHKVHPIAIYTKKKRFANSSNSILIRRLLQKAENLTESVENALNQPNVYIKYRTFDEIFAQTPLFMNWMLLKPQMRLLAVRILQIWQFGGVSFDLTGDYGTVLRFIEEGHLKFDKMAENSVWVDIKGLHMATKTPCHAFFGKIFSKLQRAGPGTAPETLFKSAFAVFCHSNVVIGNDEICKRYYFRNKF